MPLTIRARRELLRFDLAQSGQKSLPHRPPWLLPRASIVPPKEFLTGPLEREILAPCIGCTLPPGESRWSRPQSSFWESPLQTACVFSSFSHVHEATFGGYTPLRSPCSAVPKEEGGASLASEGGALNFVQKKQEKGDSSPPFLPLFHLLHGLVSPHYHPCIFIWKLCARVARIRDS